MKRRSLLGLSGALALQALAPRAHAKPLESAELTLVELDVPGDRAFGRALLFLPRPLPSSPKLLVLLHGLGETHDQHVGSRAFAERYGLLSAVARLSHPPLGRTHQAQDYFGAGRLEELNLRLSQRPYQSPVLLCPFTPNPYKAGGEAVLERYVGFLTGRLKNEVEQRVGTTFTPSRCMISGVSLGGYIALEVFLRKPELFCALGTAQGAFGQGQAARYAAGIEGASQRLGPRRVEILTSSFDPYRRPNELLHQQLMKRKQASRLRVSPGPHDQRWLKESGTIEMLLSADDVFAGVGSEAK
jgi:pimeloyl-ACP methyl ester carboxylesterase